MQDVGSVVGGRVGCRVGRGVGSVVGTFVGDEVGVLVGTAVGCFVGAFVGAAVTMANVSSGQAISSDSVFPFHRLLLGPDSLPLLADVFQTVASGDPFEPDAAHFDASFGPPDAGVFQRHLLPPLLQHIHRPLHPGWK